MSPKSRKTSVLWSYYKVIRDTTYAKCSFCPARISYKTSSTNLKRHLERKHPTVYLKIFQLIADENIEKTENADGSDPLSVSPPATPRPIKPDDDKVEVKRSSLYGKRSSKLWNYFEVINNEKQVARCTLCELELSFRSTNTNLRKHLERRHNEVYATLDSSEAIRIKPKYRKSFAKARGVKQSKYDEVELPIERSTTPPRTPTTPSVERRKVYQTRFALSWDSYQNRLCSHLNGLLKSEDFVDLTLAADGHVVKVHQLIMGIASPYIKEIILSSPTKHPIIFLTNVSYSTLQNLLQYIYTGQVDITEDELEPFFVAAKALQIQGIDTEIDTDILKMQADDQTREGARLPTEQTVTVVEDDVAPECDDFDESQFLILPRSAARRTSSTQQADKSFTKQHHTRSNTQKVSEEDKDPGDPGDLGDVMMDEDMVIVASEDLTDGVDPMEFFEPSRTDDPDPVKSPHPKGIDSITIQTMILNHYKYGLASSNEGGIRKWRCIDHMTHGCPARTVTNGNTVVKRSHSHNHPFNDKK